MRSTPSNQLFLVGGILFSLLVHASLVLGYLWLYARESEAEVIEDDRDLMVFEEVELLKWGEVMPEPNELPVIANPAPDEQPEEVVVIEPEPEPEPEPEEPDERPITREDPEPEEQPRDNERHNPHRPANDEQERGNREGFRGGTSFSQSAVNMAVARIQDSIQRAYDRPAGISDAQLRSLEGQVQVYFNNDGRITRYRWIRRSGSEHWDSAAEGALNAFRFGRQRLPLPTNLELRAYFVEEGLNMVLRFSGR